MNKIFAGIGSRKTPPEVCEIFTILSSQLCSKGWTLRSGRAEGADKAFEYGARGVRGKCEIFLPNMHNYMSIEQIIDVESHDFATATSYLDEVKGSVLGCKVIARLLHPNGKNLSREALELHARNTYQILGQDLNTPVNVVICWTEGGRGEGGTGQALRLAKMLNIPIIDYGVYNTAEDWWKLSDYIISMYGSK